eukprot:gene39080-47545_t
MDFIGRMPHCRYCGGFILPQQEPLSEVEVDVRSKFEAKCSLEADAGVSLSDYMRLPVEQYVCIQMPLNASLERLGGSLFNLTVPPVRFFHLDVSPMLFCEVTQTPDAV